MVAFIIISGLTLGLTHTVKLTVKPTMYKNKKSDRNFRNYLIFSGAEDGAQTRDPQLGRLMLYQLSYFRNFSGQRWIRTTEGVSQQIYSLPHLATLVFAHLLSRTTSNLSLSRFVSQLRCKGTSFFWICKRWDDFFLKKKFSQSRWALHFFFPKKRNETKKIRRLRSRS